MPPVSADVGVTVAAKGPVLPWRKETQKAIAGEQREIDALVELEKSKAANSPNGCPGNCCPTPPASPSATGSASATPTGSASATQADTKKEEPLSPVLTIAIVLAAFIVTGLAFGLTKKKSS